ncbi:MAG TPA: hypothetical protein VFP40_19745 [Terriglobales bacterium]|nr:hypothetical protein [Terriglobales bacterium]
MRYLRIIGRCIFVLLRLTVALPPLAFLLLYANGVGMNDLWEWIIDPFIDPGTTYSDRRFTQLHLPD